MNLRKILQMIKCYALLLSITIFVITQLHAQETIRGHVYNMQTSNPVFGAIISSSSGKTSLSNKKGEYIIAVLLNDTIWFAIGKRKSRNYLVKNIAKTEPFDVYLRIPDDREPAPDNNEKTRSTLYSFSENLKDSSLLFQGKDSANVLDPVSVLHRNYHDDSLRNRKEYEKYFNYKNPKTKIKFSFGRKDTFDYKAEHMVPVVQLASIRLDVGDVYNILNKGSKKQNQMMKHNLLFNEQQGYIDNRFKNSTIVKYIGAQPDSILSDFIQKYRPTYEQLVGMQEIELAMYIKNAFKNYSTKLKEEPEQ